MVKRIVVADDEASIRRLIVFVLKQQNHETFEATNGEEALRLVRQEQPDLVILDVMMPGMNGFEVARTLRMEASTATTPILFCSAGGEGIMVRDAQLEGEHYTSLTKPFTPKELRERVVQILAAHSVMP